MKTHPIACREDGNILAICLLLCAVIGFAIFMCFYYVRNQMAAAARSQSWNESLVVSEAGIEDGMMLINKYSGTTIARGEWTNKYVEDGWSKSANVYSVHRVMDKKASYAVYVTNNADGKPTMRCVGTKEFSGGAVEIRRAIVVQAVPGSLFQGGLIAKGGVELKGNVLVDSFNSQVAGANTNGQYHPSIRRDNGSIASASSNVVAEISANGSVEVYGKIYTGPEDSFVNKGQATVGSEAFVDGTSSGVESGSVQNDLNIYIPDAPEPPTGGQIPTKENITFQGAAYANSFFLDASAYKVWTKSSFSMNGNGASAEKIVVKGHVQLYVPGDFKMTAGSQIIIGTNSSLTIYAGGSVDLGGQGVMNQTGFATNLTIYGLKSCTSITYSGGSQFIGTIYAPYAELNLVGGGSDDLHFVGSAVASTIKVSGHMQVHYDESLIQLPSGPHYYAISWKEIALQTATPTTPVVGPNTPAL